MKRTLKTISFLLAALLLAAGLGISSLAQTPYPSLYWIAGRLTGSVPLDGRQVVFFREPLVDNNIVGAYSDDISGPAGLSGRSGEYVMNAFEDWRMLVAPGTYFAAVVRGEDNYGADPVEVALTGNGYDFAPDLALEYGAGPNPPLPRGPVPVIKVWFGNRLYQPSIFGLAEDQERFYVPEEGELKIEVRIQDPYQIDPAASYAVSIQEPEGALESYDLSRLPGFKASEPAVMPFVIESPYPRTLAAGEKEDRDYIFTFNARSAGVFAPVIEVTTVAAVTVAGGPAQLIGQPLTYPSPVHLKTDKQVTFQYTLNKGTQVEIFLFDVSGRVVKKLAASRGEEGGAAGVNKLVWNLITDQGQLVSSGIYVFTIVNREDGKLLGRGKFTCLP